MTTKRIYAEQDIASQIRFYQEVAINNNQIGIIKGFIPKLNPKFKCIKLNLLNTYSVSNDDLLTTINSAIEYVYCTQELPNDYNQKIRFFNAASKVLDSCFIKMTIKETLEKTSQKVLTSFLQSENTHQISIQWCRMCRICNKIDHLIYCLPHDGNVINTFCEQIKKLINIDQKQKIEHIIVQDFSNFDNELLSDMKETFDFLCKLEIYSDDFVSKIESTALGHFKTIKNKANQTTVTEKLHLLSDTAKQLVYFASVILKEKDIKKLTCDLNDDFAKFLFEYLEKELPNLIKLHQIPDINFFLSASNAANKAPNFFKLLNISFEIYAENLLKSSSEADLFQNLVNITSYLLELCKDLGKHAKDILLPTFHKIMNENSNHIAVIVAFGIDDIIRNQLQFDISTIFFIFKHLESKDIFEAYHANLLLKRIRHNNGNTHLSDIMLTNEIRSDCGEFYAKRFDLLIDSSIFSRKCFDSFCNEFEVPKIFNVFLVNSNLMSVFSTNMNDENEDEKLPEIAKIISAQYFGFLRDYFPNRKFQWCLKMTEVELKCFNKNHLINNDIDNDYAEITISCNAYCASLILSFNDKNGQTLQDIKDKTNLTLYDIECICSLLISEKVHLLYKDDNKFYINYTPKNNVIKIPSLNTINSPKKEKQHREYILDNQIDCFIIKLLKNQKNIHKSELFQNIKQEIGNQVTEERYLNRIENLQRKYFISLNEYEIISYIS